MSTIKIKAKKHFRRYLWTISYYIFESILFCTNFCPYKLSLAINVTLGIFKKKKLIIPNIIFFFSFWIMICDKWISNNWIPYDCTKSCDFHTDVGTKSCDFRTSLVRNHVISVRRCSYENHAIQNIRMISYIPYHN